MVARLHIAEERVRGRKAAARKEAKEQRKVARATAGLAKNFCSHISLLCVSCARYCDRNFK